uniref:Sap30-like n=1 Tax=Pygocentrus nattereri TaxID=42514 RepID=A0AAR2LPA4_PYGNA
MMYGLETVALSKRQEAELEVAEMKMLRFSLGVTRMDKIRNEQIRGTVKVEQFGDKAREARLRWFGHVLRNSGYIGQRMLEMELSGRRRRGRPQRRFMDIVKVDMEMSCCLIADGERCGRPAGNASFSKRIQKSISQKKLKLDIDKSVRHLYICDFHKNFIQSVRNKRKRKTSDDGGESPDHDVEVPEVDLFQLQVNTLRRYKRHYKIQTRPGLNKAQLAETVSRHFRNIPVNEKETLTYFIYMVKSSKSRLDQKSEGSKQLE